MHFFSVTFVIFLMAVFLVYWMLPFQYRTVALLIANVIFCGYFDARYLLFLFLAMVISYSSAIMIEKTPEKSGKKAILIAGLVLTLSFLAVCKYANFSLYTLRKVLNAVSIPFEEHTLQLIMPLGISFYTFEMVGYLADVYRGNCKAEKSILKYAVFSSFFANVSSGPIERAGHFLPQLEENKRFSYEQAVMGLRLVLFGALKKFVFADSLARYVNLVFDDVGNKTGLCAVLATVMFTFQIYCDFSGYSDMAVGFAKLFGFELVSNFKSPYFADGVKDFWRRWHISLSTWLRDYVYIPLGGSRVSTLRKYRNLLVTFLVSGLWHGANFTFILWGGIHGVCQIIEDLWRGRQQKREKQVTHPVIRRKMRVFVTFCIVSFAWLFFRANYISEALFMIRHTFPLGTLQNAMGLMGMTPFALIKICAAIIFVMCFDYFNEKEDLFLKMNHLPFFLRWTGYIAVTALILVLRLHSSGAQEFIYFKF